MENPFEPYELQFSDTERKKIIADGLKELRILHNYRQKEIAELLKITKQRYSNFETAKTEPPIEILVRLAFLYKIDMDTITQKNRFIKGSEEAIKMLEAIQSEINELEKDLEKSEKADDPQAKEFLEKIKQMKNTMEKAIKQ